MKMKQEHYDELKDSLLPAAAQLKTRAEYNDKGLSDTRYVWDVLWNSRFGNDWDKMHMLHEYLNDNHIETALRSILL